MPQLKNYQELEILISANRTAIKSSFLFFLGSPYDSTGLKIRQYQIQDINKRKNLHQAEF